MRYLNITVATALALSITACSHRPTHTAAPQFRASNPDSQSLVTDLRNNGIAVVQQGQRLQLVLSTDRIFGATSMQVKPSQVANLRRVADLIKLYGPKATIQVRGYTAELQNRSGRKVTSTQYAQAVASFLWNDGVSKHRMKINGYGKAQPIASNMTPQGSAYNRRVEILVNYP